jgi:hypothetical protein
MRITSLLNFNFNIFNRKKYKLKSTKNMLDAENVHISKINNNEDVIRHITWHDKLKEKEKNEKKKKKILNKINKYESIKRKSSATINGNSYYKSFMYDIDNTLIYSSTNKNYLNSNYNDLLF